MLDARFLAWLVPMPCLSPCGCDVSCTRRTGGRRGPRWRSTIWGGWMPDVDSNHD